MNTMKSASWLDAVDDRLAAQLRFLIEADRLKSVSRGNCLADGSRRENVAEHSWHLALFAMVLSEWAAGVVDGSRVLRMLIVHDLIELESENTAPFGFEGADLHEERERRAAERVFRLLPTDQRQSFLKLWEEFEAGQSADAHFAKSLDGLQPTLLTHAVRRRHLDCPQR
jgi:putative hydrolase of HD superfamily